MPLILKHGWAGIVFGNAQDSGMNFFRILEIWVELMAVLGYERLAAQGGDLGAGVETGLGLHH